MPYIVKSSLDIGGKIIPWNEQETKKLIKEKKEFLENKNKEEEKQATEYNSEQIVKEEAEELVEVKEETKIFRSSKKNQKAGEK